METNFFSPSINIQRDQNSELTYIPTRNGEKAFNKILSAYDQGTKSFNIIGAYGSGKSTFILAFERTLNKKADYFQNPLNGEVKHFRKKFLIGVYNSFKNVFCSEFNLDPAIDPIQQFKEIAQSLKNEGILIVVDEFGKFLEFAAKENPEEELYFIQQLAEVVNSPDNHIFFITTLHQAFEDYALSLTKTQKKEWDKVKGRLIEVSFNEPVEQLLFLASERLVQKKIPNRISEKEQQELFQAISLADSFPMKDYFSFSFAKKIFPFDILSASVVTLAFQSYGQNERSLFTFLESEDYLGLNDFKSGKEFYHLAHVYDYLIYNFHSLLNSRFNPHAIHWRSIDEAIQRTESVLDDKIHDAIKLIKAIGLLSIFGGAGQKITKEFLGKYGKIALNIEYPRLIVDKLEEKQIIRYRSYSQKFILFKGTDFDIDKELDLAEDQISKDFSLVDHLNKYFNFPILQAKKAFYEIGTPRYFVISLSEHPIKQIPENEVDGYINLIFSDVVSEEDIKNYSQKNREAILFGLFKDPEELNSLVFEAEKLKVVKSKCADDPVAASELDDQLKNVNDELNKKLVNSFYGHNEKVTWFFQGKKKEFKNSKDLNGTLSEICFDVYTKTPEFKNELINRQKLTGTISGAKNKLFYNLLYRSHEEDIGFEKNKFPPEKTIYLSLLKSTGIHDENGSGWAFQYPEDSSFSALWDVSQEFLDSCAISPRKLTDFVEKLKNKPFKLKQGFIEFWVPIFLVIKQKHIAFYEEKTFIPSLTPDTIEVAMKQPQKYYISTFPLDEKRIKLFNRYRYFLNQIEETTLDSETFIETIKPFLTFYRRLLPFSQNTRNLSTKALRFRTAIANAEDPQKIFFEDIPAALGYNFKTLEDDKALEDFTVLLHNTTRELSGAFSALLGRLEEYINDTLNSEHLSFPDNKYVLQQRFKKVKKELLNPKLKVILQRINTPLDDRQSWLSSVATAILNKTPDKFTDDDEAAFKNLFPQYIHELDNISDISERDIDSEKEEVLKLEVTSFVKGVQKHLLRMPKEKSKQLEDKLDSMKSMLDQDDKQANIALLLKLLQEEIENE
ncbi:MAG: hypothetical protein ACOC2M_01105 [bacterium]